MREQNKEGNSIKSSSTSKRNNPLIYEEFYRMFKEVYKEFTFCEKELIRLMFFEKFSLKELSDFFEVSIRVLESKIKHIQDSLVNVFNNECFRNDRFIERFISSYFSDLMKKDNPVINRDIMQDVKKIKILANITDEIRNENTNNTIVILFRNNYFDLVN